MLQIKKRLPPLVPVLPLLEGAVHENNMSVFQLVFRAAVQTMLGGGMVNAGYPLNLGCADKVSKDRCIVLQRMP